MEKSKYARRGIIARRGVFIVVCSSLILSPLVAALRSSSVTVAAVNAVLGLLFLVAPTLIERRFSLIIPTVFHVYYYLFLWFSIFFGELVDLYYIFPFWDDLLHFSSAFVLSAFIFSLFDLIFSRRSERSFGFTLFLLSFCLSVTVGVLWEIFEYAADGFFGFNMQKFISYDGGGYTTLVGREALKDTMSDLMLDLLGALSSSVLSLVLRAKNGRIAPFLSVEKR